MLLLPPAPGTCPACAVQHARHLPHDRTSIYYQMRFYGLRGRWPTWADATAHCIPEVIEKWKLAMVYRGIEWTEPAHGDPIADPPEETISQPIGDINSRTFGPEVE